MENKKQISGGGRFILLVCVFLAAAFTIGCGQRSQDNSTPVITVQATPTPAPPENFFPAALGKFNLSSFAKYDEPASKKCACQYFQAIYGNGTIVGVYGVEVHKSPEEARLAFNAKKYLNETAEIVKQSENDLVAIRKTDGSVMTARLAGANLILVSGRKDSVVIIENNLPYQTLGIAKPPPARNIKEFAETPVLASLVQKDFQANQAEAAKKYGVNYVLLKAKVASFGDEVETKSIAPKTTPTKTPSRPRPSRTIDRHPTWGKTFDRIANSFKKTPTPTPKPTPRTVEVHHPFIILDLGGEPVEIRCDFNEKEVKKVLALKPGQEILFRGKIAFVEGRIQISDARIDDFKYEGLN